MENLPKPLSHSDVYIFKGENSKTDEERTSDDVEHNCINQKLSTRLSVVKCLFPTNWKDD